MKRVRQVAGASPPAKRAKQGTGEPCPPPAGRRAAKAAPRLRVVTKKPPPFVPGDAGPAGKMEPLAAALARVIERERVRKEVTFAELAGHAHVDAAGVLRYLRGERRSSVDLLARCARVLRMDPVELMREAVAEMDRAGPGESS